MLEVVSAVRRYGEARGLDGLDLAIPTGSIFGILGPNGSGKSTMLTLLAAGEQPESGAIRFGGELLTPSHRKRFGIVFQEPTMDPLARVSDNLELAGKLYGLSGARVRERGEALLAALGLGDRWGSPIASLSGGMRRRVEIARALLHSPALLLLDEPTSGVDPTERRAIWEELRALSGGGCTIVLATNDLAEADEVCTHAAFLAAGRAVAQGTVSQLKHDLERESVVLEVEGDAEAQGCELAGCPGASRVSAHGQTIQVTTANAASLVPELFKVLGGSIRGLQIRQATLQDAYFQLAAGERDVPIETETGSNA